MANRSTDKAPRRRKRRRGVSVMLTVVLIITALLMGGLAGFIVARRTDPHVHELQEARDRVTELENTLTLIGYPVDEAQPQQWLFDNTTGEDPLAQLSGDDWGSSGEADVWNDESLLEGTLPKTDESVVVAEFEGGVLLSDEVIPVYNDQLTNQIFAGHSADEVAEATLNSVLAQMAGDKIIATRAKELGLTELTEEDLAAIDREAAENYETQLADYVAFVSKGAGSRDAAAQALEEESGVTLQTVTDSIRQNWWTQKFYDYIVREVTVSDEEVQAYYDTLLAKQKETFTAYPEEFEYAHQTGEAIVYNPPGFRAVRDILIPFDDDVAEEAADLMELVEAGTADADAQARLNALFEPLEAPAQEAQQKLADGQSFTQLMDEYDCDEALREEPMRSEGYYISDASYVNSVEYVEGSMMLEQPGQVSSPLRSMFGLHLVEYIGDVPAGEVPLSDVLDAMREGALAEKQAAYYAQQRQALLDAANVKYYPERLR